MPLIQEKLNILSCMKKYPSSLNYSGNLSLLNKQKISIVGTRKPSKYTREITYKLASLLAKHNVIVVSGGAMGVDAIAHQGAGAKNTISVLPCGIDIKYPSVNKALLTSIEQSGLLLSQFEDEFKSRAWSFVLRNELIVALGEVLVVSEADLGSGSMRSVEYALGMEKKIYVLPHRLGESEATNTLVAQGKAEVIYNIETFVSSFSNEQKEENIQDDFLKLCSLNPSYEEIILAFPQRTFEAELAGEIKIINGIVILK